MKTRLPHITIKTEAPPAVFLDRMAEAAREHGEYLVRQEKDQPGEEGFTVLRLKPLLVSPHKELEGQLIAPPDASDRVTVVIQAKPFIPDPPDYRVYQDAAHSLFDPILHLYNRRYDTNRRLSVPGKAATEPYLPPVARELFATLAEKLQAKQLTEEAWVALYHFVIHCKHYHVEVSIDDLVYLLTQAGVDEDRARSASELTIVGRRVV